MHCFTKTVFLLSNARLYESSISFKSCASLRKQHFFQETRFFTKAAFLSRAVRLYESNISFKKCASLRKQYFFQETCFFTKATSLLKTRHRHKSSKSHPKKSLPQPVQFVAGNFIIRVKFQSGFKIFFRFFLVAHTKIHFPQIRNNFHVININ